MISVMVNTYERRNHLLLCLTALSCQHYPDFEVIVVDDGGDDGSCKTVIDTMKDYDDMEIRYVWHPHRGFGPSKSRNEGAALSKGEMLVFIDSDILLNSGALRAYGDLYEKNPNRAIGGYYQYLPGMMITTQDVVHRWEDIWERRLPPVPIEQRKLPMPGNDVRLDWFLQGRLTENPFDYETEVHYAPFNLLSANFMVPGHIWAQTHGFDETWGKYGGEDAELSIQIANAGYGFSYSKAAAGAHMAHPKHPGATEEAELAAIEHIRQKWPQWFKKDGTPIWGDPNWQHPPGVERR